MAEPRADPRFVRWANCASGIFTRVYAVRHRWRYYSEATVVQELDEILADIKGLKQMIEEADAPVDQVHPAEAVPHP